MNRPRNSSETARFRALILDDSEGQLRCSFGELSESDLPPGEVLIGVSHSSVNYKDGLAVTGKGRIARTFPIVPGIDLAGLVIRSESPDFRPGDRVFATGWGMGEIQHGGYSERARLTADKVMPLPDPLTSAQAMAFGTAGVTAMFAVVTLEERGLRPGAGPVLVTGATGGVGSLTTHLLAARGHEVVAVTGRPEEMTTFLTKLGAARVVPRSELARASKPLESERWSGAVDTVGGEMLSTLLAQMRRGAGVACCGNARSPELHTTVFPFILRGIALLGIDSNWCPVEKRSVLWSRLASEFDLKLLDELTRTIPLSDVPRAAEDIVAGRLHGRTVVEIL